MLFVVTVCISTCLFLIGLVFLKPSVKIGQEQISIYWLPPVLGALVLAFSGALSWSEIFGGLTAPTATVTIKDGAELSLLYASAPTTIQRIKDGIYRITVPAAQLAVFEI